MRSNAPAVDQRRRFSTASKLFSQQQPADEMSGCSGELHSEDLGILWTEAHCTSDMLDCDLRFIKRYSRIAAELPCRCQVWIEQECSIDQGSTVNDVAHDNDKGETRRGERNGILLTLFARLGHLRKQRYGSLKLWPTRTRYGRS
jgi:hypothetical protein